MSQFLMALGLMWSLVSMGMGTTGIMAAEKAGDLLIIGLIIMSAGVVLEFIQALFRAIRKKDAR